MAIGDELSNLNFESMIGGPLMAVIKAQAQSAMSSLDFIKSVGFSKTKDGGAEVERPTMVTFSYQKQIGEEKKDPKDPNSALVPVFKDLQLSVPILTMLPIPFIRVEETTVDFNAKITSVEESSSTSSHDLNASLQAKAGWGPFSAKLNVNYAYKKTDSSGNKVERTYTMAVKVKAVQDELPAGTERLISILERSITEVSPPASPAAQPQLKA